MLGSSNPSVAGTSSRSVLMSYFGRVNYGYKDRYLFEGNFRMMVRPVLPKEIVGVFSLHSLPDGV